MLREIVQNASEPRLRRIKTAQTPIVLQLEGDEASLDLGVLQDLLAATPTLRVYVETYDPETGHYRLAILGKLDS